MNHRPAFGNGIHLTNKNENTPIKKPKHSTRSLEFLLVWVTMDAGAYPNHLQVKAGSPVTEPHRNLKTETCQSQKHGSDKLVTGQRARPGSVKTVALKTCRNTNKWREAAMIPNCWTQGTWNKPKDHIKFKKGNTKPDWRWRSWSAVQIKNLQKLHLRSLASPTQTAAGQESLWTSKIGFPVRIQMIMSQKTDMPLLGIKGITDRH